LDGGRTRRGQGKFEDSQTLRRKLTPEHLKVREDRWDVPDAVVLALARLGEKLGIAS
jgi:hypothetical protein